MTRIYIVIALLVFSFWAGWEWRDRSADLAVSVGATKQANTVVAQVNDARAMEHEQASIMASIGASHEEDRAAAPAVADVVVAELRSGALRLRHDLAAFHTDLLSQTAAGALERNAATERREEFASRVVRIGRDADDQLRACQAVIAADRNQ